MKNLFDYATKELSQDAFLCWLFDNYSCEQQEVRDFSRYILCWFITDNLSQKSIKQITNAHIKKQFKKIDVIVECEFNGAQYVIVIEDKTYSAEHNEQLVRYRDAINNYYKDIYQKIFVYYKTDIIGKEEISHLTQYNVWKIKNIKEIYKAFKTFLEHHQLQDFHNEILHYYYESLSSVYNAITRRPPKVSEWKLRSWHSFFQNYIPPRGIEQSAEIRSYQNQYYYYKFNIDGHKNDLPSIEVRSRDYKDGLLKFRVVVYNVNHISEINLAKWKKVLIDNNITVCNRKDFTKNKQIGKLELPIKDDNESSLIQVFDLVGNLLIKLYGKTSLGE